MKEQAKSKVGHGIFFFFWERLFCNWLKQSPLNVTLCMQQSTTRYRWYRRDRADGWPGYKSPQSLLA